MKNVSDTANNECLINFDKTLSHLEKTLEQLRLSSSIAEKQTLMITALEQRDEYRQKESEALSEAAKNSEISRKLYAERWAALERELNDIQHKLETAKRRSTIKSMVSYVAGVLTVVAIVIAVD